MWRRRGGCACWKTLTVVTVAMHYEDYRYIRPEDRSSGRHLWAPHSDYLSYLQPPTVLEGWHMIPQSILQHSPNGSALKAPPLSCPPSWCQHKCADATLTSWAQNPHHPKLDLLESITVTWLQLLGKPASQLMTAEEPRPASSPMSCHLVGHSFAAH